MVLSKKSQKACDFVSILIKPFHAIELNGIQELYDLQ
jgi:hypothetical protein